MSYTGHYNSYNMTYNNNKGRQDIRGGLAGTSKNKIDQLLWSWLPKPSIRLNWIVANCTRKRDNDVRYKVKLEKPGAAPEVNSM